MVANMDSSTSSVRHNRLQLFDVKVSHAKSLQSLNEVRRLSQSIGERINSVTSLMSNQTRDIRRHLHMVKETTARYCELQKRLELAAQLTDDSCQPRFPSSPPPVEGCYSQGSMSRGYCPRKISQAASVLSASPISSDTLGLNSVKLAGRRAVSCGDLRCKHVASNPAESDCDGSSNHDSDGSSSDVDSGVALEATRMPPAPSVVASLRAKGAEYARIATREEIVARYLEKQHQRQIQPPDRPCSVAALENLGSSFNRPRENLRPSSCHLSPRSNFDEDAASDAASRWSSVSHSGGSRRMPEQSFESEYITDRKGSQPRGLATTSMQAQRLLTPAVSSQLFNSSGRASPLSSTVNSGSPLQLDSTLKWRSTPNFLSNDEDMARLDEIFMTKSLKPKGKTASRGRQVSQNACVDNTFNIQDENRYPNILYKAEKSKHKPTNSGGGFFGFLKRKAKGKGKDSKNFKRT